MLAYRYVSIFGPYKSIINTWGRLSLPETVLWRHILKVEYHADAVYENPSSDSEKITCVGQRLLYLIMEKNNILIC